MSQGPVTRQNYIKNETRDAPNGLRDRFTVLLSDIEVLSAPLSYIASRDHGSSVVAIAT